MFAKFLLTVAVVAAIWFGFQYLQRLAELKERRRRQRVAGGGARPSSQQPAAGAVQDLVKCSACGTWVPGGSARSCGRPDCTY